MIKRGLEYIKRVHECITECVESYRTKLYMIKVLGFEYQDSYVVERVRYILGYPQSASLNESYTNVVIRNTTINSLFRVGIRMVS